MSKYICVSNKCSAKPPCIINMSGVHPGVEPECCMVTDAGDNDYVSWDYLWKHPEFREKKIKIRCYRDDCKFNDGSKSNCGWCKKSVVYVTNEGCMDYMGKTEDENKETI